MRLKSRVDGAREKEKSVNAGWTQITSWHTEALTISENMVHPGGLLSLRFALRAVADATLSSLVRPER
ncbi:hypothetical protein CKF42_16260 [Pantoea sp. ARC270]|jgi:hypothetical protein|nr:hypothetical protein CKF42_16260 [Pantoea sp. ARC270]